MSHPTAAIWRSQWLPASETFVRDHVTHLDRWRPLTLGLTAVDDRLGIVPDRAPFPANRLGRKLGRLSRRTGYAGVYDTFLRSHDASLLHAHFGTDATECRRIVRRLELPFIVTFHGYDATAAPRRDTDGRYRRELAEVFAQASVLLPVSNFIAGRIKALGAPADKVRVHYLGIPALPTAPTPPEGPRQGPARIVFVGRLEEGKGVDHLIQAFARLPRELRDEAQVDILGDGSLRPSLERLAHGIEGRVRFHGRVSPAEVAATLADSTLFVGPSQPTAAGWDEGLGLVFLEAAQNGVPVLSYATGGVPEAVQDGVTGLLAPVGDMDALTAHMELLLRDTQMARRMGEAGRARIARDFDLSRQTQRLERIYDECVGA
ncbi:glycosyltransferase [Gephyromycinifex aptenodytis]|uniref:glycosyltransferase n=1 Tax=Gephyromycinifex aptenodytis TaxID=2716227 RepID=UPI001444A471|nr:glycosyltransferase [Gephyromycinifex aptenodytis]